ncbi:MAG: hypothetical protein ABEJ68_02775 [Halobacteriaceae archaeon]
MKLRFDGLDASGRAVDARGAEVSGAAVAAAVRDPDDGRVRCPDPGPVHEYVGHVRPEMATPVRAAVAAAARSRGATAPEDEDAAELDADRERIDVPEADVAAARRRAATAGADVADLREEVARLRGEIEARRELDADAADAEAALADATRRLSEAETERIAAEQALERARRVARDARDARERRLALADRADNKRREARERLARDHYGAFRDAVAAVPGDADPGPTPAAYEGDSVTAALAAARLADVRAPVVLACDRFGSAAAARDCLDAPVVLV